mmetsp:Transcript_97739/g.309939  ORF Transcript_97739/g.309939 Transcript_97739/m.309939 type:complete len:107 (+) Transcript_97739:397-717(+)
MEGWARDQKVEGSMVTFLADTRSELTKALDLVLDAPPAMAVLGNPRCKRFSILVEDGVIKAMAVLGNPRCKRFSILVEDGVIKALNVAGGDVPDEETFVEKILTQC